MPKYFESNQSLDNQRGEITFRRKLVAQQTTGNHSFDGEFDSDTIEKILKSRIEDTVNVMKALKGMGHKISPYVEIGAERGQRSLAMENDLDAHGAAVDLSFDMLRSCEYYAGKFGKSKLPLRICTDLYAAPFKSGSLPFVFGYQVLHHFPDPQPIVAQVHRILAPGGVFFIAEEPFKPGLHFNLYQSHKNFSTERRTQNILKKLLDHFLATETCNEVEYGVIENDEISPKTWRRSFEMFEQRELRLLSLRRISSNLYGRRLNPLHIANALWGGEIVGWCKKAGSLPDSMPASIEEALTCPDCLARQVEPCLTLDERQAVCTACGQLYPVINGVLILLPMEKRRQLYPEIN